MSNCSRVFLCGRRRPGRWSRWVRRRCAPDSIGDRALCWPSRLPCRPRTANGSNPTVFLAASWTRSSSFSVFEYLVKHLRDFYQWKCIKPTWKQLNKWSNCSGVKSHASLLNRSCTFFSMASCLPTWDSQILSKSFRVNAFSLIRNRRIFSSFSTYCGWCMQSRNTMSKTSFSCIHFFK